MFCGLEKVGGEKSKEKCQIEINCCTFAPI
jgi:hypothetical protein